MLKHNLNSFNPKNFQIGLSLIELMVVVMIISILSLVAIPYFKGLFQDIEAHNIKSIITTSLRSSKTESYIHSNNVILCSADANNLCNKDASEQLIVFFDNNDNRRYDSDQDIFILKHSLSLAHGKIYLRAGRRHYIKFSGNTGTPRGFFGHIKYCPDDIGNNNIFKISFSQTGRVTYKPDAFEATECPS